MSLIAEKRFGRPTMTRQPPVDERLLLHDVRWAEYEALGEAFQGQRALRVTYDRGNLEIMKTGAPPAPTAWTSDSQRLLLYDIGWCEYETVLQALDRHHLRTTYDDGSLELMTLSPEHEGYADLLRLFIQVLAEECRVAIKNLRSTTFRRHDLERGLEADDCFYTTNWPRVRGKKRLDLTVDPPPDLVAEIDVTRTSLDRMAIYAALRVPEVWRFDGERLFIHVLGPDGQYHLSDHSPTFPDIPIAELARFLREGLSEENTAALSTFRAWVKKTIAKAAPKRRSRRPRRDSRKTK